MELSDDKRSVQIAINRTLSATELQTVVVKLATVRSEMLPEVSAAPDPDALTSHQEEGGFAIRRLSDGRIQLLLRHTGIGWLPLTLGVDQACILRDFLVANTPHDRTANLITSQVGEGGLPQ